MTALASAFEKAGYVPPEERLRDAAVAALVANPRSWDGAKDALFEVLRRDVELLWKLSEPYRAAAVQALLTRVAEEMRADERARAAAARPQPGSENRVDPRPSLREVRDVNGVGRKRADNQVAGAHPVHTEDYAGAGRVPLDRRGRNARAGMAAVSEVARLSILDTFLVNNRPIGDVTPREAMEWAGSRERHARFARLLAENLPLDQPIRKYRTPEDAEALHARAQEMAA